MTRGGRKSLVALMVSCAAALSAADGYDFIIVGGGTAGAALASRLSQQLDGGILLIEAGPAAPNEDKINVPGMKGSTVGGPYDWNLTTTPQAGANGRTLPATRGKVLGGSSALNLMVWNRASKAEYDAWEELGNPGWNWDAMTAAMKKSENFTGINSADYGSRGVGTGGPVHSVVNRYIPAQQDPWIPALESLGLKHNRESLGGDSLGVMNQPSSIDPTGWKRSYSANAYLPGARDNLHVLPETRVARINLIASRGGQQQQQQQQQQQRATGVTLQNGTVIAARKEVIVSAGTFQSPGLLELSGIGRKSVLDAAGITQLVDLPGVGENLQDHVRFQNSYQLTPAFVSMDVFRYNATYAAEQLALWRAGRLSRYDYTGSGIALLDWKTALGNEDSLDALARAAIGNSTRPTDRKLLELIADASVPELEVIFSDGYTGVKGYPAAGTPLYGQNFFTLLTALMHPVSRGSVHVASVDVATAPLINPNYLSSEHDVQAAVAAVRYARKIATSPSFAGIWTSEYEPGLNVTTDDQLRQYVKGTVLSVYHPVGTCAMLPRGDGGVVSPQLKVWGTENLRVVDASIIPLIVASHTQTAVYGIAERAAEIIVREY